MLHQHLLLRLPHGIGRSDFRKGHNRLTTRSTQPIHIQGGRRSTLVRNGERSQHLNYSHGLSLLQDLFSLLDWNLKRTPGYVFWTFDFSHELISNIFKDIISLLYTDRVRVSLL